MMWKSMAFQWSLRDNPHQCYSSKRVDRPCTLRRVRREPGLKWSPHGWTIPHSWWCWLTTHRMDDWSASIVESMLVASKWERRYWSCCCCCCCCCCWYWPVWWLRSVRIERFVAWGLGMTSLQCPAMRAMARITITMVLVKVVTTLHTVM